MTRSLILWTLFLVCFLVGPALAVQFNHAGHQEYLEEDQTCTVCHKQDAKEIVPTKEDCLECHEEVFYKDVSFSGISTHGPVWSMNHRVPSKSKSIDCSACHEQEYCLECHKAGFADEMGELGNNMINVHRAEFHVSHPIAARTDPQLCSSCHENRFCVDCHARFAPADLAIQSHRRGWTDNTFNGHHAFLNEAQCVGCHPSGSVLPSSTGWSSAHGREARKNLVTCQSCHPEGDICLTCHSARTGLRINPHPKDWNDMKDRLRNASDGRTCRKCH